MKKHPFIRSLVKKLKALPSFHLAKMVDYWGDFWACGIERDKKLVYVLVLAYDKDKTPRYDYHFDLNLEPDDPEGPPFVNLQEVENVSQDEIIQAIRTFLDI